MATPTQPPDEPRAALLAGDCLDALRLLPDAFVDAIVTDPPSAINFMGLAWDDDKGGREQWIRWLSSIFRECWRVLRPGAHMLVWSLPKTAAWTATAIERAGFQMREGVFELLAGDALLADFLATLDETQRQQLERLVEGQALPPLLLHIFGNGFPKSHDVSKALDASAGVERLERERYNRYQDGHTRTPQSEPSRHIAITDGRNGNYRMIPATDDAKTWDGWGTALKPAVECWWLARKPLESGRTVATQVRAMATGALHIDACRVGTGADRSSGGLARAESLFQAGAQVARPTGGRWPANLLLQHAPGCVEIGTKRVRATAPPGEPSRGQDAPDRRVSVVAGRNPGMLHYGDTDGTETVADWRCVPACPVALLDAQSGVSRSTGGFTPGSTGAFGKSGIYGHATGKRADRETTGYGDTGGASRFFPQFRYATKPSRSERDAGCTALYWRRDARAPVGYVQVSLEEWEATEPKQRARGNIHATVKSIELMRWLLCLITPPGGLVVDPFAGSVTTGMACLEEGFSFLGVERERTYLPIAEARLALARAKRQAASTSATRAAATRPTRPSRARAKTRG